MAAAEFVNRNGTLTTALEATAATGLIAAGLDMDRVRAACLDDANSQVRGPHARFCMYARGDAFVEERSRCSQGYREFSEALHEALPLAHGTGGLMSHRLAQMALWRAVIDSV